MERVKLGSICKLRQGFQVPLPKQTVENKPGYVRFIRIVDYTQKTDDVRYIEDSDKYYHVEPDDVVMIRYGAAGEVGHGIKGVIANNMFLIDPQIEINKDYLYYYLSQNKIRDRLLATSSSTTMPALNFKIVNDLDVPLYDKREQDYIVKIFDLLSELIENQKKELQMMDELIKSRFVELFGMPGTDEFGWGLVSLGSVCCINPKKGQDSRLGSGVEVSFVPMPAVTEHGEIDATAVKEYDEVKTGFTYFAENDVLFAKITPCMENGKGAVARGLHNGLGFGSTEFHVLRPISGKSNPYWIYTLTAFSQFREDAASNMTGSAGQRRVPASFLENYLVALPPIELQEQFAAFIEQVNKSKFKVQESLKETQILLDALMQEYFG